MQKQIQWVTGIKKLQFVQRQHHMVAHICLSRFKTIIQGALINFCAKIYNFHMKFKYVPTDYCKNDCGRVDLWVYNDQLNPKISKHFQKSLAYPVHKSHKH